MRVRRTALLPRLLLGFGRDLVGVLAAGHFAAAAAAVLEINGDAVVGVGSRHLDLDGAAGGSMGGLQERPYPIRAAQYGPVARKPIIRPCIVGLWQRVGPIS